MPLFGKKHLQKEVAPTNTGKKIKAADTKPEKKAELAVVKPVKKADAKTDGKKAVFAKGSVIVKAHITEKSGALSQNGVYTFEVLVDSNSRQIADAIKAAYKVTPVKVTVAAIPAKTVVSRGKTGKTAHGKKAYVYLKKGDTIEFI
jgi:large subunit ribosomal protein L23